MLPARCGAVGPEPAPALCSSSSERLLVLAWPSSGFVPVYIGRRSKQVSQQDVAYLCRTYHRLPPRGFQRHCTPHRPRDNCLPINLQLAPAGSQATTAPLRKKERDQSIAVTQELVGRGQARKRSRAVSGLGCTQSFVPRSSTVEALVLSPPGSRSHLSHSQTPHHLQLTSRTILPAAHRRPRNCQPHVRYHVERPDSPSLAAPELPDVKLQLCATLIPSTERDPEEYAPSPRMI